MGTLFANPSNYPLLVNCRAYIPGRLDTRAGLVVVNSNALGALVYSLKRLNDPLPGAINAYAILAGAGSNLWLGQVGVTPSSFTMIDVGYSGNPLGWVPYRPPQSPESWLYVSDSLQMRKVRADGTVFPQGIAPPLNAPAVDFGVPLITNIEDFNESSTGNWNADGVYATGLTANAGGRVNDSLTTPFATASPGFSAPGWIPYLETSGAPLGSGYGRGMRLILQGGSPYAEDVIVSGIYPASLDTTIQAIQYDQGTTGPCCIVPATPLTLVNNLVLRGALEKLNHNFQEPFTSGANLQVQPDTILSMGSPYPEDVIVLSSTPGPLGTFSIRANTVHPHSEGATLEAVSSLRAYCTLEHNTTAAAAAGYFRASVATGIGLISNTLLPVDLSVIGSRPTQPGDEIHLSVRLNVPGNLIEGRILFDVSSVPGSYFGTDYYYASFQASQLTPAVASTSTTQAAIATSISTAQIDAYNSRNPGGYYQQVLNSESPTVATTLQAASVQSATGNSTWTELFIPLSNLVRVGSDTSRTLANVRAVQLYFNVSATTLCDFHGLYLKGSYGPDVGTVGNDYYYCYRRRSTLTGAMSNASPYIRSGLRPHGQRLAVTMPGDNTEGDQLDVFRWGGTIVTASASGTVPWLLVGSATNPGLGNTVVFNDDFADADIANAEVLEFTNQQPYATIDTPKQGTCLVVGTSVIWQSGDQFNTQWQPGSLIEINGVTYTLYAQPKSPKFLEIVESATTLGAGSAVTLVSRPTTVLNGLEITAFGDWLPFEDPQFAYDNNPVTFSSGNAVVTVTPLSCWWMGFTPVGASTFTNLTLNVLGWATGGPGSEGLAQVLYALDGGVDYLSFASNLVWGGRIVGSPSAPFLGSIALPLTQPLDLIVVAAFSEVGGTSVEAELVGINEIYLTATYTPGVLVPVPFIVREPTILAEPMYAQWGPFLGYLQAVGDPYQPGVMHCTQPNNPDSGNDQLDVEICPPTETLMNGCMYGNGASFVWSNQRLFQLASASDLALEFTPTGAANPAVPFVPQEVPGSQGLFAPWFFCVADQIYYGTATGIVRTTGGTPTSITDPDLSLLFPRDGQPGQPVTLGSVTFQPPDFTQTQALRLFPERDHIKFAYIDINGNHQVIVYSLILNVWSQDQYVTAAGDPTISCLYAQEGQSVNSNLVGGLNYVYQESGPLETGNVGGFQVRMAQSSDLPVGYMHGRDGYLGLMSVDPVSLVVNIDGTDYTVTVPATGGGYLKQYVTLPPFKGKALEWAVTSATSARLFLRDTWFNMKPWAGQKYAPIQPFRDLARETKP